VDELLRAARVLEQEVAARALVVAPASATWTGPLRSAFDHEHQRLVARARGATEACRRAAAIVAAAGDDRATLTRGGRFS